MDGYVPPLLVIAAAFGLSVLLKVRKPRNQTRNAGIVMVLAVCLMVALELGMGRPLAYKAGPVRLWAGDINSDQNSQQLTDPYTLTHVVHGAVFYGLTRLAMGAAPVAIRAIVAITVEASWEVLENTDMVVNRYRAATIALGYYGDSVTNSVTDVLACFIGFLLAWRLPRSVTIAWVVLIEVILAIWIRDNLTLNILMLLHPVAAIRQWQMGA